ncbi:serine/threonine-protein kinase [Piscinibacter sp. XHJ-5]|uniref:serine/threonine protein kinase n=1 Tax=Piscinibacter sp. XHJ-5 TaxID=3037797 RepID=UPI002453209F|nr:serine/threonine-protein kinase [Piscinibacter sp. XHJ-5]
MDAADPLDGADESVARAAAQRESLPPGTRLTDFEILRTLGSGGFGTVYLARDHVLDRDVAIKEYLPTQLAYRGEGLRVEVRSANVAATYAAGLRSFVNEARILARFNHPAVVKVHRFWEANGTAYMVMPWVRGPTLREMRRSMKSPPTEAWLRGVLDPLLDALAMLHAQGIYHRDIAPDNVLLPSEQEPVLLDFGAARRVIGDRTQGFTAVLKPSFAPIEQYAEANHLRQGPWTDLYALGAVIVYLLTAVPPPPSTVRSVQDEMPLLTANPPPGVSATFLAAIQWALAVRPQDRPQSVQEFCSALDGRVSPPPVLRPMQPLRIDPPLVVTPPELPNEQAAPPVVTPEPLAAAVAFAPPVSAAMWDPTIRLVSDAPMASTIPVPPPLLDAPVPPAAPRWRSRAAIAAIATLCVTAAMGLLHRGPPDPELATWRALGRQVAAPSAPLHPSESLGPGESLEPTGRTARTESAPPPILKTVIATAAAVQAAQADAAVPARAMPITVLEDPQPARRAAARPAAKKKTPAASVKMQKPTLGPREACGDRNFISMAFCINSKCRESQFEQHPQCIALQRQYQERRQRYDHP